MHICLCGDGCERTNGEMEFCLIEQCTITCGPCGFLPTYDVGDSGVEPRVWSPTPAALQAARTHVALRAAAATGHIVPTQLKMIPVAYAMNVPVCFCGSSHPMESTSR